MPAVLINSLSAAPRGTTLVSPVTMAIPAARAVSAMLATTASGGHLQPLFENKAAGKIARDGAADRHIVGGTADGKLADIAAGKEQRVNHVAVGGEGEAVPWRRAPPDRGAPDPPAPPAGLAKACINRSPISCCIACPPLPWANWTLFILHFPDCDIDTRRRRPFRGDH